MVRNSVTDAVLVRGGAFHLHHNSDDFGTGQIAWSIESVRKRYSGPEFVYEYIGEDIPFDEEGIEQGPIGGVVPGTVHRLDGWAIRARVRFPTESNPASGLKRQFHSLVEYDVNCYVHVTGNPNPILVDSISVSFDFQTQLYYVQGGTDEDFTDRCELHFYTGQKPSVRPGYGQQSNEAISPCGNSASLGSVDFRLSLGKAGYGEDEGLVVLRAGSISSIVASRRRSFSLLGGDSFHTVFQDSVHQLDPLQFYGPRYAANYVDVNPSDDEFGLVMYQRDLGLPPNPDGTMPVEGSPVATVTVSQPAGPDSLRIETERGGQIEAVNYSHDPVAQSWAFEDSSRNRRETLVRSDLPGIANYVETRTTTDLEDTVISKVTTTWTTFPFGTRMTRVVIDPDGRQLATDYVYYDNQSTDGDNYGELKHFVTETGYWERFIYDDHADVGDAPQDYVRRRTKTVSQFRDTGVGATEADSIVEESSVVSIDGDPSATLTVKKVLGQETSRAWEVARDDGFDLIRGAAPGNSWDDPDNSVSKVRRYTSGAVEGKTRSVTHPDGRIKTFSYDTDLEGNQEVTIREGAPNLSGNSVVDGIETVTLRNPEGAVLTKTTRDIDSDIVLESQWQTEMDPLGRVTEYAFSDGTSESWNYDCCGVSETVDRAGISVTYDKGVSDGAYFRSTIAGGIKSTIWEDGRNEIRERKAASNEETEIERIVRNVAGEVVEHTAYSTRTTEIAQSTDPGTGRRIETTTFPDLGGRVREFHKDGRLLSESGSATYPVRYEYGVSVPEAGMGAQYFTKALYRDRNGVDTGETLTTHYDALGRPWRTAHSGTGVTRSYFDKGGRILRAVDADNVGFLFAYDAKGQRTHSVIDMDADGVIDLAGPDRVSKSITTVAVRGTIPVFRTVTTVWRDIGGEFEVSSIDSSADGRSSWTTVNGITSSRSTVLEGSGDWVSTWIHGDESVSEERFEDGRLRFQNYRREDGTLISGTEYRYDPHGRLGQRIDRRNGATSYTYHAGTDDLDTVTSPPAEPGGFVEEQSYTYDDAGRLETANLPGGRSIDYAYYATGELRTLSGWDTPFREYSHDARGRLVVIDTAPGEAVWPAQEWNYNQATGLLTSHEIAGQVVETFNDYTSAGRIESKTNANNVQIQFGYDESGALESVDYSDSTPDLDYTYYRTGDVATVTQGAAVRTYTYPFPGVVGTESVAGGLLDGLAIDYQPDNLLRRSGMEVDLGSESLVQDIAYEVGGPRLDSVSQGVHSAHYFYQLNSPLVQRVERRTSGQAIHHEGRRFDRLERLTSWENVTEMTTDGVRKTYLRQYGDDRKADTIREADGRTWHVGYDSLGQVTSFARKNAQNQFLGGQQRSYGFDGLGNRLSTGFGGDASGLNLDLSVFTPDPTDPSRPETVETPDIAILTGSASANASVTVNSAPVELRQGEFFSHRLTIDNSGGLALATATITATEGMAIDSTEVSKLIAPAEVEIGYDNNGNTFNDGRWQYAWDAENRLKEVTSLPGSLPSGLAEVRVVYSYDPIGRKESRSLFRKAGASWLLEETTLFVHDGDRLLAEFDGTGGLKRSHLWGLDRSGTMGGAGGAGGLVATTDLSGTSAQTWFVSHDDRGSVVSLADAASGAETVIFDYDAFGNAMEEAGASASGHTLRYQGKLFDPVTGLYDFGARHYDPAKGRFLSRDPLGDAGGVNLYGFVGNDPVNRVDVGGYMPDGWPSWLEPLDNILLGRAFEPPAPRPGITDPGLRFLGGGLWILNTGGPSLRYLREEDDGFTVLGDGGCAGERLGIERFLALSRGQEGIYHPVVDPRGPAAFPVAPNDGFADEDALGGLAQAYMGNTGIDPYGNAGAVFTGVAAAGIYLAVEYAPWGKIAAAPARGLRWVGGLFRGGSRVHVPNSTMRRAGDLIDGGEFDGPFDLPNNSVSVPLTTSIQEAPIRTGYGSFGWGRSPINSRHVLTGEINSHGAAVGFHHRFGGVDPSSARVTSIIDPPNALGVYRARVEIMDHSGAWVSKASSSTFFPDAWSQARVMEEITGALVGAQRNIAGKPANYFEGLSPSGVRIGGYLNSTGGINTAFPIY